MLNLSKSTATKAVKRNAVHKAGLATAAPRIGDTKVKMAPLEDGNFINYQRIEDNLQIVRKRCDPCSSSLLPPSNVACDSQVGPTSDPLRKDPLRALG